MGKAVVITGAGSGIGRATAHAFLAAGDRVALIGRRREPLVETAADFPRALVLPCDVTIPDQVETAFDAVVTAFGRIDVLFNNAGTFSRGGLVDDIPVEEWLSVVSVNLTGAFLCARAAFARMRRQVPIGGRIINNGSISAHAPRPGSTPYTTTKHAITGLTKSLSLDGRPFDIACSQIDVGNAMTEIVAGFSGGARQADGTMRPEPTIEPEDVARSVVHMAALPLSANVQFMTLMATKMPFIGRG